MAGIKKNVMPESVLRSMSSTERVEYNADYSIALEYKGSLINNSMLLKVLPIDVDSIPTAKVAASPAILYNLSLPIVQPIRRDSPCSPILVGPNHHEETPSKNKSVIQDDDGDEDDVVSCTKYNGVLKDGVESSGMLGFSDTSQDHSLELSDSSDLLETLNGCDEIEAGSTSQHFGGVFCEEEDVSDGEHLECRRKKKGAVTFCDHDSEEESMYSDEGVRRERPVPEKPPKKGMCYHCRRGSRFTEKEACLVCDAKFCRHCIRKAMGSMPEGRKCLTCVGFPVDESKRKTLGKSSWLFKGWFNEKELRQIMQAELSCAANQLPPHCIFVNGRQLRFQELMLLRSCPNPPRILQPGSYWYDRTSGFWGKEDHKPCQIITPNLNVGGVKLMEKASNGNTKVTINGREITKAERWMLKSAGVMCAGSPNFWVQADGAYLEEGMKLVKGKLWGRKRTKLVCALLSLPTPESPNPRGKSKHVAGGALSSYLEHRALCEVLLVGNDCSGTSTIYKQARVIYNVPFSEEERQNLKFMIQSRLYGYLGRLLEGREIFEEKSLLEMSKRQSSDPGPSDYSVLQGTTEYTVGQKLKVFSDWLINVMVSSNLELIFPAATREYAPYVEELWNDPAIQATYSRRDELELPRVASYFLDRAVEISKVDYEPSDTDIMCAEGITSSNGLASIEFSFPQMQNDDCRMPNDDFRDPADRPADPITRCQLIRVDAKSLGEKCKWLEMFEDVGIVLFCVALTDYDEYEMDSNGVVINKMLQSKRLFESIITDPKFKDKNFLLILNKFDLLEEKIEQVPLTHCEWFQDFSPVFSRHQSTKRNSNSIAPLPQRAFHYIAVQFKRLFKTLNGRNLYVCPVTALESDTVDSALKYAREILRWEEEKPSFTTLNEFSSESIYNSSYS